MQDNTSKIPSVQIINEPQDCVLVISRDQSYHPLWCRASTCSTSPWKACCCTPHTAGPGSPQRYKDMAECYTAGWGDWNLDKIYHCSVAYVENKTTQKRRTETKKNMFKDVNYPAYPSNNVSTRQFKKSLNVILVHVQNKGSWSGNTIHNARGTVKNCALLRPVLISRYMYTLSGTPWRFCTMKPCITCGHLFCLH